MLQKIFSDLMKKHSQEIKQFMQSRAAYQLAVKIGSKWGPEGGHPGNRLTQYLSPQGSNYLIVWLYAAREDSSKDVAIFIDEFIENHPDLTFANDWSEGADVDRLYRHKKGGNIRFIFSFAFSAACKMVKVTKTVETFERVCV